MKQKKQHGNNQPCTSKSCSRLKRRKNKKSRRLFKKTRYLDQLEALNSQLSLLYTLQIFAFKVKVLEVTVGNINEQLIKSGVLLKTAELENIKNNIDALKILIEAQYESMKEIRETENKTLDYIH